MSSILEALKKLEEEKTESTRVTSVPLDREIVRQELTGRAPINRRVTVSTGSLILGGVLAGMMLVAASAAVALLVSRTGSPVQMNALASSQPQSVLPASSSVLQEAASPAVPDIQAPPMEETADTEMPEPPVPQSQELSPAPVEPIAAQSVPQPPPSVQDAPVSRQETKVEKSPPAPAKDQRKETKAVSSVQPQEVPAPKAETAEGDDPKDSPNESDAPRPEAGPAQTSVPEKVAKKIAKANEESPSEAPAKTKAGKTEPAEEPAEESDPEITVVAQSELPEVSEPIESEPVAPAEETPPVKTAPKNIKIEPVNVYALPPLKESDKSRFGLKDLQINMVRPATRTRPQASAIINLQTVYVGETIPDSDAILIGVETRGIAVEIADSGARYHVRF